MIIDNQRDRAPDVLVLGADADNFSVEVLELPHSRSSTSGLVVAVEFLHQYYVGNSVFAQLIVIHIVDIAIANSVSVE